MIKKIDMPLEDQETTINYAKHVIGDQAEVYTTDKVVMKRYERFTQKHPDLCRVVKDDKYSMTFSVDVRCASIYPKAPRQVNLTDEQKEILRERMKTAREKKKQD